MPDDERHDGRPTRLAEVPCECPDGCGCDTPVIRGEGACEGCARGDEGEPGTDHLPCDPGCTHAPPHFGPDGRLADL